MAKRTIVLATAAVCLANAIALVTGNTSPLIVAGHGFGEADAGLVRKDAESANPRQLLSMR